MLHSLFVIKSRKTNVINIYITWIIQTRLNMIMFSDCADEISEDIGRIYQVQFYYSINFRGKIVFFLPL